jgi:hypothetical protein
MGQLLHSTGESTRYPLDDEWGRKSSRFGTCEEDKFIFALAGIEPQFLERLVRVYQKAYHELGYVGHGLCFYGCF